MVNKGTTPAVLLFSSALFALTGCAEKRVQVELGHIDETKNIYYEDIVGLTQEELQDRFLGQVITLSPAPAGGIQCGLYMNGANICARASQVPHLVDTPYNPKVDVNISVYYNFSHEHLVDLYGDKDYMTIPEAAFFEDRLIIDEFEVGQDACEAWMDPEHNPSGCELSLSDYSYTAKVFSTSYFDGEGVTKYYLDVIPLGVRYSYPEP